MNILSALDQVMVWYQFGLMKMRKNFMQNHAPKTKGRQFDNFVTIEFALKILLK